MKKTFIFGLIAAALGFTACSNEDDNAVLGEKTQKGMVLNATVAQPTDTRATIDNSAANWQFAFAENDQIKVTNSAVTSGTYYTFTNNGTTFASSDATATTGDANWFAYFPSNSINLTNQAGTLASVANLYALAGKTASATTGESDLDIAMCAKVAILKIENYKESAINIQVKTSATDYVTGLTAKSGEAGFDVVTSTTEASLLTTTTTGDYYVAVPAGVQFSVMDGSTTIKSTESTGLTAGKYYPLFLGDILPTYVSSTGSDYGGEGPEKLIDAAGTSTKWCSSHSSDTPWEIVVKVSQAAKLKTIKLWNANDTQTYPSRIWKTLKVYGSTTGEADSWSLIKDFTSLSLVTTNYALAGTLSVDASVADEYYKLEITAGYDSSNGKYTQQMSDMKFDFE